MGNSGWTADPSDLTLPADAGTGTTRIFLGGNTPPELLSYGVQVAILFYVVDVPTNLEIGYFFIGLSNVLDTGTDNVLLQGEVIYPVPGNPSSPTAANVKTHYQMTMNDSATGRTKFKDFCVDFINGADITSGMTFRNFVDNGARVIHFIGASPIGGQTLWRPPQPTPNGNSFTNSAAAVAFYNAVATDDQPAMQLLSPGLSGKTRALIELDGQTSTSGTDNSLIQMVANAMRFFTTQLTVDGTMRLGPGNQEIGQGVLAGFQSTANSAAIGAAETVVGTCNATTFYANHAYAATLYGEVTASVVPNDPVLRLRKTNAAGQQLGQMRASARVAATGYNGAATFYFRIGAANVAAATLVVTALGSGAFNTVHAASGTNGRGLVVEDIGSALNPALNGLVTLV